MGKREQTTDAHKNVDESQIHETEWKKLDTKGYIQYDSIYTILLER